MRAGGTEGGDELSVRESHFMDTVFTDYTADLCIKHDVLNNCMSFFVVKILHYCKMFYPPNLFFEKCKVVSMRNTIRSLHCQNVMTSCENITTNRLSRLVK